ncbi:MAG: type II secretion system protein [Alphaproteobacteria bacterium]|nr:type II secretion system protein [Alphaproteobacteria bacterium]
MNTKNRIFSHKNNQRGGMLIELLMSVAIVALVLPFLFKYQQDSIVRAENITVARKMQDVQTALERYIVANREVLLNVAGKSIARVDIDDLAEYGVPDTIIQEDGDKYQLRVLKSADSTGQATLQGVVVMTDTTISPLRTRQIVEVGGDNMGFIEGTHAYGTFGAWHTDAIDIGITVPDGIISTTSVRRDNALYLWREPSDNPDDAKMLSPLNLGGHDIIAAQYFDASGTQFDETLKSITVAADKVVFSNRTTIDSALETKNATCVGNLSADSKTMEIAGTLSLADTGKFSSFTVDDLWTNTLSLSGLSNSSKAAVLNVNQRLDMTDGHINAVYTTVSFSGSITPRLVVRDMIVDSINDDYYWDVASGTAHFYDVSFPELERMATLVVYKEADKSTVAGRTFSAVAANKNATVADYMHAIFEIQSKVRAKYSLLKF